MMNENFEKILIASPTAEAKNYCIKEWLLNINKFTYTNIHVVLIDNTIDGGKNARYLNELAKSLDLNYGFNAIHSNTDKTESVIERMAVSHNIARGIALGLNINHWLHLESDVFPEFNIIEELLFDKKPVVGALYYTDSGIYRKLMVQRRIYKSPNNICTHNFIAGEDVGFIDGNLKEVASVGLGCVLIHKSVFSKIQFRFEKGKDAHPDSYFSEDCFRNNIKIFADTKLICKHENSQWDLIKGKDY